MENVLIFISGLAEGRAAWGGLAQWAEDRHLPGPDLDEWRRLSTLQGRLRSPSRPPTPVPRAGGCCPGHQQLSLGPLGPPHTHRLGGSHGSPRGLLRGPCLPPSAPSFAHQSATPPWRRPPFILEHWGLNTQPWTLPSENFILRHFSLSHPGQARVPGVPVAL